MEQMNKKDSDINRASVLKRNRSNETLRLPGETPKGEMTGKSALSKVSVQALNGGRSLAQYKRQA